MTDVEGMREAVDSLPSQFAHVDVLVNNAGVGLGMEPADKASLQDWNTMIDTNIKVGGRRGATTYMPVGCCCLSCDQWLLRRAVFSAGTCGHDAPHPAADGGQGQR